jgi:hypothetical protein
LQEDLCRGADVKRSDKSEDEAKNEEPFEEEENDVMDLGEVRLIRAISKIGKRSKVEVSNFSRNLNLEELIDWINNMEEYFEYEEIEDPERVKFEKAMLTYGGKKSSWREIEEENKK